MLSKANIAAIGAMFLVAGCDQPGPVSPSAQFASTSEKVPSTFDFVFPFFADCLGEQVVWAGSAHFEDHIVTHGDGSVHVNGQGSLLPGNTITSSSGIWSPSHVRSNYVYDLTASADGKDIVNERITWRDQTTGTLMDVYFRIHVVYAGNGELKRNVLVDHHCELRK
jgi:hypothetical protein